MIIIQYEEYRKINEAVMPGVNDLETWCKQNGREDLLREWDYDKNGSLTPANVAKASNKKYWWKCQNGHTYQKDPNRRTNNSGCPYCANKKVWSGYNDLETWCKESGNNCLLDEWDYEKNVMRPCDVLKGTGETVGWVCPLGHHYDMPVGHRTQSRGGYGCPVCAGKKVFPGYNDLESWCKENDREDLLGEWDYQRNDKTPNEVTKASGKKFFWVCSNCGGTFEQSVQNRVLDGQGCPVCAKQKNTNLYLKGILRNRGSFADWCKKNGKEYLLNEWDYEKNDISPDEITKGSTNIAWWKCSVCGLEYPAKIGSRTSGRGCPDCAKEQRTKTTIQTLLANGNSLYDWCMQNNREDLLDEWDYDKNDMSPEQITKGSTREVVWRCTKSGVPHNYTMPVGCRTNQNQSCPYCSGQKVLAGYNDLETWCKDNDREYLLSEWDYERNKKTPSEINPNSHLDALWVCPKGHRFKQSIRCHCVQCQGCPRCRELHAASAPEKLTYFYLDLAFKDRYQVIANDRTALENGTELDIYIPALKVAVEYDGAYYHKEKTNKEAFKNKQCRRKGIELIRIREKGLATMDDCHCIMRDSNKSLNDMNKCIQDMLDHISTVADVELPYDIWDIGGEDDFINCKRDLAEATRLRDEM